MPLLILSFIAGVLTVLAPCTLPVLPIIIGGSVDDPHAKWKPYIITTSLAISIVLFTLLLKFSTAFINVPQMVWQTVSGIIILMFGFITTFPALWDRVSIALKLSQRSDQLLVGAARKKSVWGGALIGASLGPVFSSCSPTYFLILATVLPQSFAMGLIDLISYSLGLGLILLFVALLGQRVVLRLRWAANPSGWFKRALGVLFIFVGVFVLTGADKKIQTYILNKGFLDITKLELKLQNQTDNTQPTTNNSNQPTNNQTSKQYPRYQEIQNPSGFVNTDGITIGELIGKNVVLVDFMTYSCINCIRTFPYLNEWYTTYHDRGLEIVGIHTPEFAFEHKIENVRSAMKEFGIKFPVVLDNNYATWRAYGNQYWPRKYLIDIHGNIVYDHIGEGGYDVTEQKIREALEERSNVMGVSGAELLPSATARLPSEIQGQLVQSPEIYFGASRNEHLTNGSHGVLGIQTLPKPEVVSLNRLYLTGAWEFTEEFAESKSTGTSVIFRYSAKDVYMVASANASVQVVVLLDGKSVAETAGTDLSTACSSVDSTQCANPDTILTVQEDRLYRLIQGDGYGEHTLELLIQSPGLKAFTFTFG